MPFRNLSYFVIPTQLQWNHLSHLSQPEDGIIKASQNTTLKVLSLKIKMDELITYHFVLFVLF